MAWLMDLLRNHREGILYLICGAGTVLVSWATYALFVGVGIELNISNILSWICAVSFAFVVNKWVVFLSHSTEKEVLAKEATSFVLLRIGTGLISIALFPVLCNFGLGRPLFGVDGFYAKIIVSGVEIILNYVASKFIVFRAKEKEA